MTDSASWMSEAPALGASQWTTEWSGQDDNAHLSVERTTRLGTAGHYQLHRVRTGTPTGAGTVVVLTCRQEDVTSVLLVHQVRPGPGVTLWELPRGSAEPTDRTLADTGRRELEEETGISVPEVRFLGVVYPDSGLLASKVGVVSAEMFDVQPASPKDAEADEVRWFTLDEVSELVASGELRDGISLSALLLASVWTGHSLAL